MTSIYQKVLSEEFRNLHPKIQQRFGLSSSDGRAAIGKGVMHRIWNKSSYIKPFLYLGARRHILCPEKGNVPFTIRNYAYIDSYGRETVTWARTFYFDKVTRHFDATMIYSEQRDKLVDYLGSHQHLAVNIDLAVSDNGGMILLSGDQRFYEKVIGFRFPKFLSAQAEVYEWYDDQSGLFQIEVDVSNPMVGKIFNYRGAFDVKYIEVIPDQIPAEVKPVKEEKRE